MAKDEGWGCQVNDYGDMSCPCSWVAQGAVSLPFKWSARGSVHLIKPAVAVRTYADIRSQRARSASVNHGSEYWTVKAGGGVMEADAGCDHFLSVLGRDMIRRSYTVLGPPNVSPCCFVACPRSILTSRTIYYIGMFGGIALATATYIYKPDTSIQTWALQEAKQRMEARGEAVEYKPSSQ